MGPAAERSCGHGIKRARCLLDRAEPLAEVQCALVAKTGAHLPRKHEPIPFVISDKQRPDPGTGSFGVGEATDDEFLAGLALRLQPAAVPSWSVGEIPTLRHGAFELGTARLVEKFASVADDVVCIPNAASFASANERAEARRRMAAVDLWSGPDRIMTAILGLVRARRLRARALRAQQGRA